MIDRLAHFIWLGDGDVPADWPGYEDFLDLNPGWDVRLWRGPPPEFGGVMRDVFNAVPLACQQADILRAWLLYQYGGLYFDMDFLFLRPADPLLTKSPWVPKARDPAYNNCAMGGTPGEAFFQAVMDRQHEAFLLHQEEDLAERRLLFGPRVITDLIEQDGWTPVVIPWLKLHAPKHAGRVPNRIRRMPVERRIEHLRALQLKPEWSGPKAIGWHTFAKNNSEAVA